MTNVCVPFMDLETDVKDQFLVSATEIMVNTNFLIYQMSDQPHASNFGMLFFGLIWSTMVLYGRIVSQMIQYGPVENNIMTK